MLPISQRVIEKERDMSVKLWTSMIRAEQTLFVARPVKSNPNVVNCIRRTAPPSTATSTTNAPAEAPIQTAGTPSKVSQPLEITMTAPSDDPAEMPSV